MANICNNWVEIEGEWEDVKKFVDLVGKDFDLNKIVPLNSDSKEESVEKWGCSSIAFDSEMNYEDGDDSADWYFWTKWNPPYKLYEVLSNMFPDLRISWRYEESGNGLYGYLQNGYED